MSNMSFTKLELLSKHIFTYISDRVKKATGYPLELVGNFRYAYVKELDKQQLRIESKHREETLSFLVHLDEGILL